MSPFHYTTGPLFDFLILRLNKLKEDISGVAGFHEWNDVPHIIETLIPVNEKIRSEIEFIFEHWMPFFHHSTPPLSMHVMPVYNALLNILTVKFDILARPVNNETVATLLLEYNKLNNLIPIAIAELATLNQLLIDLDIDPPIVQPPLLRRQPNITPFPTSFSSSDSSSSSSSSSSLFGDQVHPLDMAVGKIYFKTYRKKHRKPRKSRKSRKLRKPRKSRKPRKLRKLRKSRKPRK
jgi:hypothetical protein